MAATETLKSEEQNVAVIERSMPQGPDVCDQLYAQYYRRIFNTAYRILGEESSAEDALQETMLNVYRGIATFRGDAKISTWISRITINVCLGMLRKGKRFRVLALDDESMEEPAAEPTYFSDPLAYTAREELKTHIREIFKHMTGKQAQVVRLHDMEGNTIEEIAEILDCPVGTVKSRLFYGRQEFKSLFHSLRYGDFKSAPVSVN